MITGGKADPTRTRVQVVEFEEIKQPITIPVVDNKKLEEDLTVFCKALIEKILAQTDIKGLFREIIREQTKDIELLNAKVTDVPVTNAIVKNETVRSVDVENVNLKDILISLAAAVK